MRIHTITRIAAALVLAGAPSHLHADPTTIHKQMADFYQLLATTILGSAEPDGKTMLVLSIPSIEVDKAPAKPTGGDSSSDESSSDESSSDDSSSDDSGNSAGSDYATAVANYQATWSALADNVLDAKPVYSVGGLRRMFSRDIYQNIVEGASFKPHNLDNFGSNDKDFVRAHVNVTGELPPNPDGSDITPDQLKDIGLKALTDEEKENARRRYKQYTKLKAKQLAVANQLAMARVTGRRSAIDAASAAVTEVKAEIGPLQDEFNTIENDLGVIRLRDNNLPTVWFQRLHDTNALYPPDPNSNVMPAMFVPDPLTWNPSFIPGEHHQNASQGWTKFSFKQKANEDTSKSHHSSMSVAVAAEVGRFTGSGAYAKEHSDASDLTKGHEFTLSLEFKRVEVFRPWLDPSVFGSRVWKPASNSSLYGQIISTGFTGSNAGSNPPLLPLLVNTFILARKLTLEIKDVSQSSSSAENSSTMNASVGYGPFSFNISRHKESKSSTSSNQSQDLTYTSDGVTILGFIGSAVPVTPNANW